MSDVQYENVGRDIESKSDSKGPIIRVITLKEKTLCPSIKYRIIFYNERDLSEIDLSTLKVEYLKIFSIDITERCSPM